MKPNSALREFYDKHFSGSRIPIESEEVLVKLLEEIAKSKGGRA